MSTWLQGPGCSEVIEATQYLLVSVGGIPSQSQSEDDNLIRLSFRIPYLGMETTLKSPGLHQLPL